MSSIPTDERDRPALQDLGGIPSVLPDVPINTIFLLLFLIAGVGHMLLLKSNRDLDKKYVVNGMMSGCCMTRILATTFRMAWAAHPSNYYIATAALVFFYAGVIVLLVVNLLHTRQVLRTQHPHIRSSRPFSIALPMLLFFIIGTFFSLVAGIILELYWRKDTFALTVRKIKLCGSTTYAIIAFIPIPIVTFSTLARARQHHNLDMIQSSDKPTQGSVVTKMAIVVLSATFLTLGAAYRLGILWLPSTSIIPGGFPNGGPWYFSRRSFYAFNFGIELFMVWFWLIARVDEPFVFPRGAKAAASCGSGGNNKPQISMDDSTIYPTSSHMSRFHAHRGMRTSSRASSACSRLSASHRATWDVAPSEDALDDMDAYLDEVLMYYQDEEISRATGNCDVSGTDWETSWEPKDGKWALRPASGLLLCYMR